MKAPHSARFSLPTGRRSLLLLLVATPFAVAQQSSAPLSSPQKEAATRPAAAPVQIQWGDFDADGLDDALTLTPEGGARLLHNLGDGSFEDVTHISGLEKVSSGVFALWQDHDGDGLADLFIGTSQGPNYLLLNLGGTFVDVTLESGITSVGAAIGAHWIDYDGDGQLDLHLVSAGENTLYHALATGGFEPVEMSPTPSPVQGPVGVGKLGKLAPVSKDGVSVLVKGSVGTEATDRTSVGRAQVEAAVGAPIGTGSTTTAEELTIAKLRCVTSLVDHGGGGCIKASSSATFGMLYPLNDKFFIEEATGRVGIGTTSPVVPLQIEGGSDVSATGGGYLVTGSVGGANIGMDNNEIMARNNGVGSLLRLNRDGGDIALSDLGLGRVGIGTTTPTAILDITQGSPSVAGLRVNAPGGSATLQLENTTGTWSLIARDSPNELRFNDSAFNPVLTLKSGGDVTADGNTFNLDADLNRVGIGTTSPALPFHVFSGTNIVPNVASGYVMVGDPAGKHMIMDNTDIQARNSDLTVSAIGINGSGGDVFFGGGIIISGGADIVERFETSCGLVEPGTVVIIDSENPGALTCSADAYDQRVAGVVSGAGGVVPGLCLSQEGTLDGDTSVAMAGRVYVKCSTENGPIRAGDRLTTATLAGHAMKASDNGRSIGAVIGKAMSSLDEETGLVLVLINLQ